MAPPTVAPRKPLPLIILGGRDRRPAALPEGTLAHALAGYKGVDLRLDGEPLVRRVARRYRNSGAFDPILVAGPAALYREGLGPEFLPTPGAAPQGGAEDKNPVVLVDTDGHLGDNFRASLEALSALRGGTSRTTLKGPIAFSSCDILPDLKDLQTSLDDYFAHAPSDYWMPQIRVPEDPTVLGPSQYKPRYGLRPSPGEAPVDVLPGHLVITDPEGFRLELLLAYFDAAYRTRNLPVRRRAVLVGGRMLVYMLIQDFKALLRGRLPGMTYECGRHGIAIARRLPTSQLTIDQLAYLVSRCFVRRRHRRQHPRWRGRMPLLDALSLATDIDTEEEALEAQRRFSAEALSASTSTTTP